VVQPWLIPVPTKNASRKLLRMLGPGSTPNERRTAFGKLEQAMQSEGISWSDVGNAYEHSTDGKYTENEMREFFAAGRKEGVEAGVKIGLARAQQDNGHLVLPSLPEMAEHCHQQFNHSRLKDTERDFINKKYLVIQRGIKLSLPELGFLASIYIKTGGATK
jgi:hypothetical protein